MTATMLDAPVRPAMRGTFVLPSLGGRYTIGQAEAIDAVEDLVPTARPLAVDIEGFGLGRDAMRLKAVTVGTGDHAVILDPRDERQAAAIRWALNQAPALALHNAPFDVPLLVRNGLMFIEDVEKVWDTLVWARLANPGEHNSFRLADCSHEYLGTPKGDVLEAAFAAMGLSRSEGYKVFDLDRPIYVHGAAIDVLTTARLFPLVRSAAWRRLTDGHPFERWGVQGEEATRLLNREQRINRIFIRRACKGLRVDLEYLDRYRDEVALDRAKAQELLDQYGMEASKPAKLTEWLDSQGLIPAGYPRTQGGGSWSGEKAHLARIDHPVVSAFLLAKQADKIENDYLQKVVDNADADDRIHPQTQIFGASATGRMSMSGDGPLHQFPGDVVDEETGLVLKRGARGIILSDPGDPFTSIDWSQIEPVVAANIAHDVDVLAGYEAGTSDLYTDIAQFAQVKRKTAKVILLGNMYGEGMAKLAGDLRVDRAEAEAIRDQVMGAMPKTAAYLRQLRSLGREHRLVFTLSGRIVPVPVGFYDGQLSVQAHKAINYTIQGSAYDVLAETIIAIEEAGLSDAIYLAMHDELVVSTSAAHDVQRIMQTPPARLIELAGRTPILRTDRADMGERWAAV
jgi:DNA polymerase family A